MKATRARMGHPPGALIQAQCVARGKARTSPQVFCSDFWALWDPASARLLAEDLHHGFILGLGDLGKRLLHECLIVARCSSEASR